MLLKIFSKLLARWARRVWQPSIAWSHLFETGALSFIFMVLVWLRRGLYRSGLLSVSRLPVPIIVVGNITVGGAGKTPLVLAVVSALKQMGFQPGIVSRGYGRRGTQAVCCLVTKDADPRIVGDEPLMLAQRVDCPIVVGSDRVSAALMLLSHNLCVDVLVLDDGLQHYRLLRDIELCVMDKRGLGNGMLLPLGPLREPISRLRYVDAVIFDCNTKYPLNILLDQYPCYYTTLRCVHLRSVAHPVRVLGWPAAIQNQCIHAVAGIGYPEQFFDMLRSTGCSLMTHAFPDHHVYAESDFYFDDGRMLLMTEKDAVKCRDFAGENWWSVAVVLDLDPTLLQLIQEKLDGWVPA